jgi:hypothetical protein
MTDRRATRLAEAIVGGAELEPPWAHLPWIPRGSIGWRMGSGESYSMRWDDFADDTIHTLDEAVAYLRRHPRAPRSWGEWVASWLMEFPDDDDEDADDEDADEDDDDLEASGEGDEAAAVADDDDDDEDADDDEYEEDEDDLSEEEDEVEEEVLYWLAFVEAEGLTGDDVAYPVFVRNELASGGMRAPWARKGAMDTPDSAMRYSPRELGWWARWLARDCKTAEEREAHLAVQPPPPPAWAPVLDAIRERWAQGGTPRVWNELTGGALALVPAMVIHGELPPPWAGDAPPLAAVEWEEDSDDRHRWAWWVFETFEDKTSWLGYLERWPPSPRWKRALDEVSFPYLLS